MANFHRISTMALVGSHELDAALAVPVVVLVRKHRHPLTGPSPHWRMGAWVLRPVLRGGEQ